ncbi:DUF803-domain-containing protein [Hesseltinella vesiculosa]|uniref:DUF803-domain-containing protein n=1 Tax=Hesseltinella vesiculosa TaxID=101127 RepID=A0A1X2GWK9_9FUNG|nr:DUF803-domain-containing protein [Hesseltinella vesiculosa]
MDTLTLLLKENDLTFSTFIGVVVSVCGNALISVALNVQKLAHNRLQERQIVNYFANTDEPPRWISASTGNLFYPDDGYSSPRASEDMDRDDALEQFMMVMQQEQQQGDSEYLQSKLWWIGITLMVLGEVGNFVGNLWFCPASTIAPLGTTTLVANVILAPLMLNETFRKRDLVGVVLAVAGAATVVLSSNEQEIALTPELVLEAMTQMQSIVYFIVTGVAIMGLTAISPWYGSQSILVDLGLVAIYGGYTVLCTKSVASLLSLTFFNMFTYPISYILIFVLAATAILQIKYLNKALQRFDSTAVIPTQFVLFTVSAITGSAVIYHDFDGMSFKQMSRFMAGCAIEFLGVYLITSKRHKRLGAITLQTDKHERATPHQPQAQYISTPRASVEESPETALPPIVEEPTAEDTPPRLTPSHQGSQGHRQRSSIELTGTSFMPSLRTYPSNQTIHSHGSHSFHLPLFADHHDTSSPAAPRTHRRRRSSLIRGISLASQLVDRTNDDEDDDDVVPSRSSSTNLRHGDPRLSQLFSGFTSLANDVFSSSVTSNAQPLAVSGDDAIEIDIPTASQLDATGPPQQEPSPTLSAASSHSNTSRH